MKQDELKEFVDCLDKIDLIDVYSLGILMNVPNNEDFEDYISELLSNFYNRSRPERRAIIQLVKDIGEFRSKYDTDEDLSVESVTRRVEELTEAMKKIIEEDSKKSKKPSFISKFLNKMR